MEAPTRRTGANKAMSVGLGKFFCYSIIRIFPESNMQQPGQQEDNGNDNRGNDYLGCNP